MAALRPSADVSVTDWETGGGSGSNLYAEIDETTVSSTDYIATEGGTAKFELTDPSADITAATMRVRFRKDGDDEANLTVRLLQNNAPTTWNPSDKGADITLSGGNLVATTGAGTADWARSVASASSGKIYFEYTLATAALAGEDVFGFANAAFDGDTDDYVGSTYNGLGWDRFGYIWINNTLQTALGTTFTGTSVLGFAIDFDNEKIWLRVNGGNWNNAAIGSQNPATNTGGFSFASMNAGPYFAAFSMEGSSGDSITANFGASAYAAAAPSGFSNLAGGETVVAEWEYLDIADTDVDDEVALTSPQFALITDPSDLRVEFEASVAGEYSSEVQQFIDRTSGLDATHLNAYEALIDGLVADGVWTELDALYIFATQDATTAGLNLKSTSFSITVNGSAPFSADDGYTGHDLGTATRYLATGFNPHVEANVLGTSQYTLNSAHAATWVHSDFTTVNGGTAMGLTTTDFSNITLGITPRYADNNLYFRLNDDNAIGTSVASAAGHTLGNRTGSTTMAVYKNGSHLADLNDTSEALINHPIYILAFNLEGGSASNGFGGQVSAAHFGGGLTGTQITDLYNHLRTYMTAVGVP